VQDVYDAVAREWHGTRYKAWPRVETFVAALPPGSLVADLGCGNGKMAPACKSAGHFSIGCDFSIELVRIAASQMGLEVMPRPSKFHLHAKSSLRARVSSHRHRRKVRT
jgi:ubiquinone/menaquinone biosynthesis C-methylase UbiE